MKTSVSSITISTLLAALCSAQTPHYNIIDLGALPGGTFGQGTALNDYGLLTGLDAFADGTQHAILWYSGLGLKVDIGSTGPGLNSGAFGANDLGQVDVEAEISAKDPISENFCGYGTGSICLPFLWHAGMTFQLPLLGGNNGSVGNINNRGEVSGIAETGTRDPQCTTGVTVGGTGPQALDFEAVVWGPAAGAIRKLALLPGDTVSESLFMNDNSQAVGASGSCGDTVLPPFAFGRHAVLWAKDGTATDLGTLGGTVNAAMGIGNIGLAINNPGQVVGASAVTGNTTNRAFLWTNGSGMRDLGTLPGDVGSAGLGVSDSGQVVGQSSDASGNSRAFLWQNGTMTDLNTAAPGSRLFLIFASAINAAGEIVGFGATSKGDIHGFFAIPVAGAASGKIMLPLSEDTRALVRQRLASGRFGRTLRQ